MDKIRIIGQSVNVVNHADLTIQEIVGNVATARHDKKDDFSLALVTIHEPTSEPMLTIEYDEYIHVTDGQIDLHYFVGEAEKVIKVEAGQTVFVEKGTRFQPVFPIGNTKYIPVCLPAFRPDRCHREDGGNKELNELHRAAEASIAPLASNSSTQSNIDVNEKFNHVNRIYHMCQKSLWEICCSESKAYFPPTFHKDGMFTHATAVPQRLIKTANHFYTSTKGDWICLELNRWELEKIGIVTVFEEAKPVGETETNGNWDDWVCPHIYGGIPTHIEGIVTNVYEMKRNADGTFSSIAGLA